MNANQAQTGINRLLQLGNKASLVSQPVAAKDNSPRSFERHLERATEAREPTRRDPLVRRDQAASERRAEPSNRADSPAGESHVAKRADDHPAAETEASKREKTAEAGESKEVDSSSETPNTETDEVDRSSETPNTATDEVETALGVSSQAPSVISDPDVEILGTEGLPELAPEIAGESKALEQATLGEEPLAELDGEVPVPVAALDAELIPATGEQVILPSAAEVAAAPVAAAAIASQVSALLPEQRRQTIPQALAQAPGTSVDGTGEVSIGLSLEAGKSAPKAVAYALTQEGGPPTQPMKSSAATFAAQAEQWFKESSQETKPAALASSSSSTVTNPLAPINHLAGRFATSLASPPALGPLQTQVKTPFGQPQWGGAIAERVAFLASQRVTVAEIHLDPPELGPLQLRVTVNQDQASVSFVTQHAAVREALDQSAFRLREMLDSEGLNLVDVDVSDKSFTEQDSEQGKNGHTGGDSPEGDEVSSQTGQHVRLSLVDHFV